MNIAYEFEALACEHTALAVLAKSMEAENTMRVMRGEALAYHEKSFLNISDELYNLAGKFRELKKCKN